MGIILSLIALMLIITLHEYGHFIAGRICKVPIHEFAIGMGPVIYKKKGKKETTYSLRAIPIGGFCAFDEEDETGTADKSLNELPPLKRIFIFAMGPIMNIVTCLALTFVLVNIIGVPAPTNIVYDVQKDTPAYNVLKADDEIIGINNTLIEQETMVSNVINAQDATKEIVFKVRRGKEELDLPIQPVYNETSKTYTIGIELQSINKRATGVKIITAPLLITKDLGTQIIDGVVGLFTQKYKLTEMSGFVGIIDVTSSMANFEQLSNFILIMALISINLAVVNLIPIPGLDGAHILFSVYEIIFRKRVPDKIESILTMTGVVLLVLLVIFLTGNDIIRMIF